MRSNLILLALLLLTVTAGEAYGRPLRLFFSGAAGLSNPADPNSPAQDPSFDVGRNPALIAVTNVPVRLFIWAQIAPPGTPNDVIYRGISFRIRATGPGAVITGHSFWNYTNGAYGGGSGRWQNFVSSSNQTSASFAGAAVTLGAGVNNSNAAASQDTHYRRFLSDGTTRLDATLLGWVEVARTQFQEVQLRFEVGPQGIVQSGAGPQLRLHGLGRRGIRSAGRSGRGKHAHRGCHNPGARAGRVRATGAGRRDAAAAVAFR